MHCSNLPPFDHDVVAGRLTPMAIAVLMFATNSNFAIRSLGSSAIL